MPIWETDEYKSWLQEKMENEAREWLKKRKSDMEIKSQTVIA
jgi:predicted house-cleaning noncanonical NTP pyrophosphatase (MazG superfamily)